MIKFILFSFFIVVDFFYFSQTEKIDSLKICLKTQKDTSLVLSFLKIGQEFENIDLDKAKEYYGKANKLSKKIGFLKGEFEYISNYSYLLNVEGKFQEALKLNLKSLEIAKIINVPTKLISANFNIGISYQHAIKPDLAIHYFLIAEKYMLNFKKTEHLKDLYSNIGVLYNLIEQFEIALNYFNKAEKIFMKEGDLAYLTFNRINKTSSLLGLKRFEEAKSILEKCLKSSKKLKSDQLLAYSLLNLVEYKIQSKNYFNIKLEIDQALKLAIEIDDTHAEILALRLYSTFYFDSRQNFNALLLGKKAYQKALKFRNIQQIFELSKLLEKIYLVESDYDMAAFFQQKVDSISQNLNFKNVSNKVEEFNLTFQTQKKVLQIKNLKQKNKIQKLEKSYHTIIFVFLMSLLFVLVFIIFNQAKKFKLKRELLKEQEKNVVSAERFRIASDMHDDLGSGLTKISFLSNNLKVNQESDNLVKIQQTASELILNMKDIVWSIKAENDSLVELVLYIKKFACDFFEDNLDLKCAIPEIIPDLEISSSARKNVFLIIKECLNNILKHSKAKNIFLEIKIHENLEIIILDDGIGFEGIELNADGNGLLNIKSRLKLLDGKIEYLKLNGTKTRIQIPIKLLIISVNQ